MFEPQAGASKRGPRLSPLTVSGLPGPQRWPVVVVHGLLFRDILAFRLLRGKQNWSLEGKRSAWQRRAREPAAPLSCGVPQPLLWAWPSVGCL